MNGGEGTECLQGFYWDAGAFEDGNAVHDVRVNGDKIVFVHRLTSRTLADGLAEFGQKITAFQSWLWITFSKKSPALRAGVKGKRKKIKGL